ncbi:tetratricopeptide repeat-containing sensor histidine kinase [Pedobacter sp. UBA5917]|jgi:signal transduction histidine kinase|uniref:tetratricopeptide repeat-containing sensor histidine kinase n=1 Tax=Pedobacter sp. UBA5917 TaxID=1947061 RepID=UPI0025CCE505|nr:tetratricopeptide repeat-containing sensor histidine kinase [Pedobacter sp. UBA5917]
MIKKSLFFLFLLVSLSSSVFAQSSETERLKGSLQKVTDSFKYVDALNRLAMLMYEKNIDSTFYYTRSAREVSNRLNYAKGKADALNNLGIFFDIKGDLQLALRYYNEAHTAYGKIKDSVNVVQTTMNIAMVYKEFGKDQRAVQWFNIAVKKGNELRQDSIMSLVIYNYLLIYPAKYNAEKKKNYITKAKEIALKYKDERTLLAIDQLIADELIAGGKLKEGLSLLHLTTNRAIDKKLYYVSMDMLIDMGDQLITSDTALALNYYKQGLALADKNGFLIYSEVFAKKLFDYYSLKHDGLSAAIYSSKLVTLQEEQDKINNSSSVDYLDYALKEQQVDALEERSKYQITLLVLTTIACLLAIAILIVIRQSLKRTKKLNAVVINKNNQMEEALAALEQSQADNTNLLKVVAHDLRSPIAAIYTTTELMLGDEGRSKDDQEMLALIKNSSKDSLALVKDLLQTQFTGNPLNKTPVDLGELLRYCVSILQNSADDKGQHIKLDAKPLTILANGEKLWRVISNLIANAVKFSPNNATIRITMEQGTHSVKIAINDEGIGIPKEIEDKIFEMFTDAKRTGTAGEQSYGLGLAICKQIIKAHDGKIWFERNAKKGTTFFIELPV